MEIGLVLFAAFCIVIAYRVGHHNGVIFAMGGNAFLKDMSVTVEVSTKQGGVMKSTMTGVKWDEMDRAKEFLEGYRERYVEIPAFGLMRQGRN